MNKILKFFIPKISLEILKFFAILVGAIIIIRCLPIDEDGKSFFIVISLFFAFPIITYFNKMMYLPASIDWILLTPNKKIHIILAHGLINIFKIIMIFILINIIFFVLYKRLLVKEIVDFLVKHNADQTFTRIPVESIIGMLGIIGLTLIFIFGILPNYIQTIQQKQNYQVKRTPKENIQMFLLVGAGLLFGTFLISDDIFNSPWLLKTSLVFVVILFVAIYSTIRSLRLYYSKKIFSLVAGGFFLLSTVSLYFYAKNDISSPNLHVLDKIGSLKFLGTFSSNLDEEIEKDLIASTPSLALMSSHDLRNFFIGTKRDKMAERVLAKWDQVCSEKLNFLCRFAYYMRYNSQEKSISLAMVRKACPSDLGSCFIVYTAFDSEVSKEEMIQNVQHAEEILISRCKDNKNESEKMTCRYFNKHLKDKQK